MTNEELLIIFREDIVKQPFNKSTNTRDSYTKNIGYFLDFLNGKNLLEVNKKDVKSYMQSLNCSDSTYNTYLASIRTLFKVLAYDVRTEDYFNSDPTFGVMRVTNPKSKEKLPLTLDEQKMMLEHCKNKRDYAILVVLLETGIRINELINLTLLQYLNRGENGKIKLIVNKGSHDDEFIYLNSKCVSAIEDYLTVRKFSGCDKLFVSNGGTEMLQSSLARTFKNIARRCEFEEDKILNISNHTMRHSCATNLLNNEVAIDVVAKVLHHHGLSIVMNYAKTKEDRVIEAVM